MSKGVEIVVGIFASLCYAGCGYGIISDALKRKKISKFSIHFLYLRWFWTLGLLQTMAHFKLADIFGQRFGLRKVLSK